MKIFISYRRKDSGGEIGRIRDHLMAEFGAQNVFRDLVDIPAGVDFRAVLDKETNECNVMLVIIGPLWAETTDDNGHKRLFDPNDFTRIEVETGLKRLGNGEIMVIPVLVMGACMPLPSDIPESLAQLSYQNAISIHDDPYFDYDMKRLIDSIKSSVVYAKLDLVRKQYEPQTVYIPAGPFLMGSQPGNEVPIYETPEHEVTLPAFRIGKYPVTNAEYEAYILETQKLVTPVIGWNGQRVPQGLENHPVTGLTWYEALSYCEWLNTKTGRNYFLPNEAQWEKACRGGNFFHYPWGNELEANRSNHGCISLARVDAYPAQNEYGCFDLVGNVRQWTCSLWGEKRFQPDDRYSFPWKDDYRNDINANRQIRRVIRGSSMRDADTALRCGSRSGESPDDPGYPGFRHGFRIVIRL